MCKPTERMLHRLKEGLHLCINLAHQITIKPNKQRLKGGALTQGAIGQAESPLEILQ